MFASFFPEEETSYIRRFHQRTIVRVGILLTALGMCALSSKIAHAAVFDVANDFSLSGNPNGVWSYGYSTTLTGSLILNAESGNINGVQFWRTNIAAGDPAAFYNPSASAISIGTPVFQPGQFALHPGPQNQFAKARLTVPTAGVYSIVGAFTGCDTVGTTTDVHILRNGVSIFDGNVSGFGSNSGPSFSLLQSLGVGDTLDFAVGFGTNGTFNFDSTGLSARIVSAAPEPGSLFFLGIAAVPVIALKRRRR